MTQEVEDNMCLGVCNDHYCKFPKSILCILSDYNVSMCILLGCCCMCAYSACTFHNLQYMIYIICLVKVDDMEDEHDYDRVVFPGEISGEDDDEIYKIPRNVVRCAC